MQVLQGTDLEKWMSKKSKVNADLESNRPQVSLLGSLTVFLLPEI